MAILPSRNYSDQAATNVLTEVKKGNKQALGEFVWQNQEKFYAIAFIGCGNADQAIEMTIRAFSNASNALKQTNPKNISAPVWQWLAQFVVDAVADYHRQNSQPPAPAQLSPTADDADTVSWDCQIIASSQRLKRCLQTVPEAEQKAFILRHQLQLNYEQIASVLNESIDQVMGDIFRARVQLFKCLSQRPQ